MFTGKYRVFDLLGVWGSIRDSLAAVMAFEVLLRFWEARGARYTLEWFLAALTARLGKRGA